MPVIYYIRYFDRIEKHIFQSIFLFYEFILWDKICFRKKICWINIFIVFKNKKILLKIRFIKLHTTIWFYISSYHYIIYYMILYVIQYIIKDDYQDFIPIKQAT